MQYHDNAVAFKSSGLLVMGGSYTIKDFSISSGQDPDGRIHRGLRTDISVSNGVGTLSFSVGRHGTTQVGDWFKGQIAANQSTMNGYYEELNFAFIGQLQIMLNDSMASRVVWVMDDVVLAQGHYATSNNWFFGGKHCTYQGGNTHTVSCLSPGNSDSPLERPAAEMLVTWEHTYYFDMRFRKLATS